MKEIKFRGKRVDNGEWVYGCLIQTDCRPYIKPIGVNLYRTCCGIYERVVNPVYEVIPETVGQYTGPKDKNGAEIYEGSVIGDADYGVGHVYFCEENLAWRVFFQGIESEFLSEFDGSEIEVIGDIHTNPELLGEQK